MSFKVGVKFMKFMVLIKLVYIPWTRESGLNACGSGIDIRVLKVIVKVNHVCMLVDSLGLGPWQVYMPSIKEFTVYRCTQNRHYTVESYVYIPSHTVHFQAHTVHL